MQKIILFFSCDFILMFLNHNINLTVYFVKGSVAPLVGFVIHKLKTKIKTHFLFPEGKSFTENFSTP